MSLCTKISHGSFIDFWSEGLSGDKCITKEMRVHLLATSSYSISTLALFTPGLFPDCGSVRSLDQGLECSSEVCRLRGQHPVRRAPTFLLTSPHNVVFLLCSARVLYPTRGRLFSIATTDILSLDSSLSKIQHLLSAAR